MTSKTANGEPGKQLEKGTTMTTNGTEEMDAVEPDLSTTDPEPEAPETAEGVASSARRRSVSVSVRGLALGALAVVLVGAVVALGWLYIDARHQLDAQKTQVAGDAHAEKVALDYAVNAATMDFKDLQAWHVKLVAGTSPELNKKLTDAGTSMEQVLAPLQWSSTAQPLVAKVRSNTGGVYVVDSFVSVQTKTVQASEALQSTATYSTTIDSNNNWQITDVGGIGSAMGPK